MNLSGLDVQVQAKGFLNRLATLPGILINNVGAVLTVATVAYVQDMIYPRIPIPTGMMALPVAQVVRALDTVGHMAAWDMSKQMVGG